MSDNISKKLKNRRGVLLNYGFFHALECLNDEMLGRILRAFIVYSENGEEPEYADTFEYALFSLLKEWDDMDNDRYLQIIEKRREAGTKGAEKRWGNEKKEEIA